VVDPGTLASDVAQNAASILLPGLLWLFLYRFTWEKEELARSAGFSRLVFWLLLLGGTVAVAASVIGFGTNLPLFGYAGNLLMVNLGGALFPVFVGVLLLYRMFLSSSWPITQYLAAFAVAAGVAFVEVLFLPSSAWYFPLVLTASVAATLAVFAVDSIWGAPASTSTTGRQVSLILGLTLFTLLVTFFTTAAVPGTGIVSAFPFYLLAPVAVGILAVVLVGPVGRLPARFGLPIAYAASTFGVLIGADLLRQPPLYATPGSILSIGGAGPFDLVALSGPLAVFAAYATYWLMGGEGAAAPERVPEPPPAPATPYQELHRAYDLYAEGTTTESLRAAAESVRRAGAVSRELIGLTPATDPVRSWKGLPVPIWALGDQENLEALSRQPEPDPQDAYRAIQTARMLVRLAGVQGNSRYATPMRRSLAFGIDLGIVAAVAAAVWVAIAFVAGTTSFLNSLAFVTAVLGFASVAYFYFVLAEWRYGTTIGKARLRLRVRDRELAAPSFLALLLRNVPKLVPLTILAYGGAIVAILFQGASVGGTALGGSSFSSAAYLAAGAIILVATIIGIGLCGLVSVATIHWSSERQRLGDFLAGTWVVSGGPGTAPPAPTPGAMGAAPYG